jgi:nucleoside-diphosphate-sugar epimerase
MRKVLVTGATGYLGSAITARLVRSGYDVRGLVRAPERAPRVVALGAKPVLGTLREPLGLLAEMKNCDAVVHVARDPERPDVCDQAALRIIRSAAEDGRVRRLLYTSGAWVHGDTGGAVADESSPLAAAEISRWRPAHERVALDLGEAEVVTVVLRPGVVYGGRGGILGGWFQEAQERGTVSYPGDGAQHWGMVHREDVAEAYALALEHAIESERYLLVDESRFTVRELAEAAATVTGARASAIEPRSLVAAQGPRGTALLMDQRFTAARVRRDLGWVPRHLSFVAEAAALYEEWQLAEKAVR